MEVTRDEFNGLGSRLSSIQNSYNVCHAIHEEREKVMADKIEKIEQNIESLFTGIGTMKSEFTKLSTRFGIAITIIVFVLQATMPLIIKYIER